MIEGPTVPSPIFWIIPLIDAGAKESGEVVWQIRGSRTEGADDADSSWEADRIDPSAERYRYGNESIELL